MCQVNKARGILIIKLDQRGVISLTIKLSDVKVYSIHYIVYAAAILRCGGLFIVHFINFINAVTISL